MVHYDTQLVHQSSSKLDEQKPLLIWIILIVILKTSTEYFFSNTLPKTENLITFLYFSSPSINGTFCKIASKYTNCQPNLKKIKFHRKNYFYFYPIDLDFVYMF